MKKNGIHTEFYENGEKKSEGNYTEINQQCGCLFYKQKKPRKEAI